MEEPLTIYVVYDHPSDYPEDFVLKRDLVYAGKVERDPDFILVTKDYSEIKDLMHLKGLFPLARMPEDDAVIKETWI